MRPVKWTPKRKSPQMEIRSAHQVEADLGYTFGGARGRNAFGTLQPGQVGHSAL